MLKLARMQISGFKSFGDRTEVVFPDGITAVVGPNGCGKSNIGDALNWVLGEQSPKMLRGRQMADVIFNGTRTRKPVGMAEVSLHFNCAEGMMHADNGRLVITRRLFRNGDSDYRINGARARLKDIQELLRKAHIGSKTYATIEQGKIDQVLNARPKDRRAMIEDAAGVSGYKHKRRLTELKLEATTANLLRVNDIVVEVRRQINSMKRQAAKARRYQKLREEMRVKERFHFALRSRELEGGLESALDAEREARDAETVHAAQLAQSEVGLTDKRETLEATADSFRELAEQLHKLEIEIGREETQIRTCRERAGESDSVAERDTAEAGRLDARLSEIAERLASHDEDVRRHRQSLDEVKTALAESQAAFTAGEQALARQKEEIEASRKRQFELMHGASELRNRQRGLTEASERTVQQRVRIETERESAKADGSRLEHESANLVLEFETQSRSAEELRVELRTSEELLDKARHAAAEMTEELARAREQEKSVAARLHTLEDVDTRFAGVSDGVRLLLSAGPSAGVRSSGVVADYIQAGAEVETAAEGYLGWILPSVILEEDADVERAASLLREKGAGRTSFICRSQPVGGLAIGTAANGTPVLPAELVSDERVLGTLRERMDVKTSANGALQGRVGDAVLVDGLTSALDLHRHFPAADYVTPEGDVVYASGLVSVGGSETGDRGLLAHNRKMNEARTALGEAVEHSAKSQGRVDEQRREVLRLDEQVRQQREALEQASHRRVELEHRTRKSTEERDRTQRRAKVLGDEVENLVAEADRLVAALEEIASEVRKAEEGIAELEREVTTRREGLDEHERLLRQDAERAAELRADLAGRQERHDSLEHERMRLEEATSELRSRVDELENSTKSARERSEAARKLLTETESMLAEHVEQCKTLRSRAGAMEREIEERKTELTQDEEGLRGARSQLETSRVTTHQVEMQRARFEEERKHLDDLCMQELGFSAAEIREDVGEVDDAIDPAALADEIQQIRVSLEAMGGVNLTAIEEFSDLEERYAFLTAQNEDLEKAMTSLKETVRRINKQSRDLFAEAFEAIRTSYQEIFKLLFNGGRADLRLEEGEDILECGIEIMAQPPGKRLTNVQLLSGGEKAMSAIALLFAVFRYQPAPFCLLDEVDAALDDVNVGRFTRMIHEYSDRTQFVIVTHNKLSMDAADMIYGVTMEEPGVSCVVSMKLQDA